MARWKWLKEHKKKMFKRAEKAEQLKAAKKKEEGLKLTRKEEELLEKYHKETPKIAKLQDAVTGWPPGTHVEKNRHPKTLSEIRGLAGDKKQVHINDVGYGEAGAKESETHQPWEIAEEMEKSGTEWTYHGYEFYPWKPEITEKATPKKLKEKMNFSHLDAITSAPSKKADITIGLNVLVHVPKKYQDIMLKNLADATKSKGHLVIDKKLTREKCEKLGLEPSPKEIREDEINEKGYRRRWKERVLIYKKK